MTPGTIYGVGLGPGDPDLMSVRADRLVRGAAHIAYFRKAGRAGRARTIVDGLLRADVREHPLDYPVTTEIPFADPRYNALLADFYAGASAHLRDLAQAGDDVVVLCEGDPFFYGSFMHLHVRLKGEVPVCVVPAITGMSAAWTATGTPVTWGDDVLTVLAATLPEAELAQRMAEADALVVMKIGRNLARVRRALAAAGKADRAFLVEYASMAEERVTPLAEVEADAAPYFSIAIVHGQGRRP
ncbi:MULTISPECIES: precorrin-2 C(20)-methyltransferase [unclassified Xanthobacter]|uniref:precorrin-2 C(20)-methyltransferase n=1 Tax=unclassified Xanthobacter TaxID=2623496 RepID=UPI001EDF1B9E|nr:MULTISPECIES: precorrin-2 C(20)-methyltransferase [unclassified Xanthobacter]